MIQRYLKIFILNKKQFKKVIKNKANSWQLKGKKFIETLEIIKFKIQRKLKQLKKIMMLKVKNKV